MNLIKRYKTYILLCFFAVGLFVFYALYKGRELEIEQLRKDNQTLREYIIILEEKVILLDSYPYEHSEIKKYNKPTYEF